MNRNMMDIAPGRAPFTPDDDFTPPRTPKSQTTTPTHAAVVPDGQLLDASGGYNFQQQQQQLQPTVKLSPFAKEFVPRGVGAASAAAADNSDYQLYEQQQQQQHQSQQNYENYQQNHTNGFHQQNHQNQHQQQSYHHHQHQQHHHHHQHQHQQPQHHHQHQHQQHQHQHQQQQQMMQVNSLQERLKHCQQPQSQSQSHSQQQQQPQRHHHHHHHNNHRQQQQQHHRQQYAHSNSTKAGSASSRSSTAQTSSSASVETIALDYLKTVMQCLNQNPGQFDTVAPRFLNIYEGMESNNYVLSNAMEDIFQESIQNPNFRYMGAKLYNLLHMLNPKPDSLFNMLLKCKLEYHQKEVGSYLQTNQQQKVRETALFLAELYMQLRCDNDETHRIQLIAENIIFSLQQLLTATLSSNGSDKDASDNVRCICLTLKLAGYDLTTDCAVDMAEIIGQLEEINAQMPGKYPLAANVIGLQRNNWGRKSSTSSGNSLPEQESSGASGEPSRPSETLRASDEPIFYGPDGRELTAEESDFLTSGAALHAALTDEEDGSLQDLDVEYDVEMDEESELAYKEFCKLNAAN